MRAHSPVHTVSKALLLLLFATLAACVSNVKTSPDRYSVEPSAVTHLRGEQTVALMNAYTAETVVVVMQGSGSTAKSDLRELTNTAMVMLGRAMKQRNITVAPEAEKTIALRVHEVHADTAGVMPAMWIEAHLMLEARYPDGTKSSVNVVDTSVNGLAQAIDGAVLIALNGLLHQKQFVSYMNQ